MEIDWTVSKQTTILIDLHFPFLGRGGGFGPILFVQRLYWLPAMCIAPHVFSFIKR